MCHSYTYAKQAKKVLNAMVSPRMRKDSSELPPCYTTAHHYKETISLASLGWGSNLNMLIGFAFIGQKSATEKQLKQSHTKVDKNEAERTLHGEL